MAEATLYVFETTLSVDGAPCVLRTRPGLDTSSNPALVGVESDLYDDLPLGALTLNATGDDIVAHPGGWSDAEDAHVRELRSLIDSDLLDAAIRLIADVATELVTTGVDPADGQLKGLSPETKRIGQRLKLFLSFNKITDDSDLDNVRDILIEAKRIMDAREA
jgi:hypothetical protein